MSPKPGSFMLAINEYGTLHSETSVSPPMSGPAGDVSSNTSVVTRNLINSPKNLYFVNFQ